VKKICIVSGSRADYGLLQWPIKVLDESKLFDVNVVKLWPDVTYISDDAFDCYDLIIVLGDRREILTVAKTAFLSRVPIAHIAGGDVTEGSYDDAMRDCISRMASIHFVTSTSAMARLTAMGLKNIHLVGNPGIDYIKNADWRKERPISKPYVVINYQVETIDGTNEIESIMSSLDNRIRVFILPNPDRGSDEITRMIKEYTHPEGSEIHEMLPHDVYLNYLVHCDELIGNSSSILYEAPALGIRTKMIGKRQKGRTIPMMDAGASERILNILKYTLA